MDDSQDVTRAKAAMRARIRRRRREGMAALGADGWDNWAEQLAQAALAQPDVATAVRARLPVAVYESVGAEPPTTALIRALRDRGSPVVVPRGETSTTLAWVVHEADTAGPAAQGRPDRPRPVGAVGLVELGCRIVITPALAVDHTGARLGQGGGYFDRIIAEARRRDALPGPRSPSPTIVFIALVGSNDVLTEIPTEPHDQRVDAWVSA